MAIVIHIGRKSGRRYRTPVMIFRRGEQFVIALTYGPNSAWVKNVLTNGGCELELMGRTLRLRQPHVLHDPERRRMPLFVRMGLGLLNVSDFLELRG